MVGICHKGVEVDGASDLCKLAVCERSSEGPIDLHGYVKRYVVCNFAPVDEIECHEATVDFQNDLVEFRSRGAVQLAMAAVWLAVPLF